MRLVNRLYLAFLIAASLSVASIAQTLPSTERLRNHVTYLASEALEGRRTGTVGSEAAARYIAGEFSRYRLKGFPESNKGARSSYFQHFPYVANVRLGNKNLLRLFEKGNNESHVDLRVQEDWMPIGFSANGRLDRTEFVFARYGITAAEFNHNDYDLDAKGRIAIVFSGTPDGDNPHGRFTRFDDLSWKAIAARNAGAKALLVIARSEDFGRDRLARLRYDHRAGDAGMPVIAISREIAVRILALEDLKALKELEVALQHAPNSKLNVEGLQNRFLTISTDIVREEVAASNVIGILEGSDPELKKQAIVIGAHYDHLGRGGTGSLAQKQGDIHHGADDNASGVAGMLELVRMLSTQRPKIRRTIVFIAFGAEEEGLLGSNYYVNHPVFPLSDTVAMLNMDMIGRMKNNQLVIGGVGTATEWRSVIENANSLESHSSEGSNVSAKLARVQGNGDNAGNNLSGSIRLTLNEDGYGPSDHSSFYAKQIPVLFFWTGTHQDYHKPTDTAEKINYDDQARVISLAIRILRSIDLKDQSPSYVAVKAPAPGRATGFNVYLGTIPNYADTSEGLLLDGVREDSPASKAGLIAGDRVVKLAGRDIRNVYDYTFTLGEMKAEQEYEVEILRGQSRMRLKIVPARR